MAGRGWQVSWPCKVGAGSGGGRRAGGSGSDAQRPPWTGRTNCFLFGGLCGPLGGRRVARACIEAARGSAPPRVRAAALDGPSRKLCDANMQGGLVAGRAGSGGREWQGGVKGRRPQPGA